MKLGITAAANWLPILRRPALCLDQLRAVDHRHTVEAVSEHPGRIDGKLDPKTLAGNPELVRR